MDRSVIYHFRGKDYKLLFNLYAMEQIEEEFGSIRNAIQELAKGKQFRSLRKIFKFMANGALIEEDREPTVTGDEVIKANIREMAELSDAVQAAFQSGKATETEAGQAGSDEKKELFDDEDDEKNG